MTFRRREKRAIVKPELVHCVTRVPRARREKLFFLPLPVT